MDMITLGRCSLCGGNVCAPKVWSGLTPAPQKCQACGATPKKAATAPAFIEMEPPPPQPDNARRLHILATISDLVGRFTYYDRKEDEDLPAGAIQKAIDEGEITTDEIVAEFRRHLES